MLRNLGLVGSITPQVPDFIKGKDYPLPTPLDKPTPLHHAGRGTAWEAPAFPSAFSPFLVPSSSLTLKAFSLPSFGPLAPTPKPLSPQHLSRARCPIPASRVCIFPRPSNSPTPTGVIQFNPLLTLSTCSPVRPLPPPDPPSPAYTHFRGQSHTQAVTNQR